MEKITYCNVCGNELTPEDRFCNICGAPVETSDDYNIENPTSELITDNYTPFNQEINEGNAPFYQEFNEGNAPFYQEFNEGNAPFYQEFDEEITHCRKHTGLIVGIAALVCFLVAGLGIWYFISHKGKDDKEKKVNTVEVVFDLQIIVKDDVDLSDVKITAEKDDEVVDLEIAGSKAVAQLEPGKWYIKAEVPNYEPIVQEIEVSEDTTETQELAISFDFTEQPAVQSAASDTLGEVTTETDAVEDEAWRQAYIDYLRDNNILNINTIPTEMDYIPARYADDRNKGFGIYDDNINKIYMISMKLYDKDGDEIPELYYLWYFHTFEDDGDTHDIYEEHGMGGFTYKRTYVALTSYSYDGSHINSATEIREWEDVETPNDVNSSETSLPWSEDEVPGGGVDLTLLNDDGSFAESERVEYYINNYEKEEKKDINDDVPWRQAYIDYLRNNYSDINTLSIEDEDFEWIFSADNVWEPDVLIKLVDYDNNGVPELCIEKTWYQFNISVTVKEYEFVEYIDGSDFVYKYVDIETYYDGEEVVEQISGDTDRMYRSLTNVHEAYDPDLDDRLYGGVLLFNSNYVNGETITTFNEDAINYIENY